MIENRKSGRFPFWKKKYHEEVSHEVLFLVSFTQSNNLSSQSSRGTLFFIITSHNSLAEFPPLDLLRKSPICILMLSGAPNVHPINSSYWDFSLTKTRKRSLLKLLILNIHWCIYDSQRMKRIQNTVGYSLRSALNSWRYVGYVFAFLNIIISWPALAGFPGGKLTHNKHKPCVRLLFVILCSFECFVCSFGCGAKGVDGHKYHFAFSFLALTLILPLSHN